MTRLLVPTSLDALVVRPGEQPAVAPTAWAPPVRPATGRERQHLAPDPFAQAPEPRAVGVHLHWAMPDALAVLGSDGRFPALPCRWLVVRFDGPADAATPRRLTTWMLPNVHAATPAVVPGGERTAQPIGLATPTLTVRGRGGDGAHPSWALTYDATIGRLAFHDPVDAVGGVPVDGPLTYLVVGWYTHDRLDPLHPQVDVPPTPTWLQDTLARLGWGLNLPPGVDVPTAVVVHGSVLGIGWPAPGWPGDDGGRLSAAVAGPALPNVADVGTAVADTLAAAVTALLDGRADPAQAALAEAALTGAVAGLAEPDGAARVDATRHTDRFAATAGPGGTQDTVWVEDPPTPGVDPGGKLVEVTYPRPRQWRAVDPVLALRGLGRTLRHGADGRFDATGLLPCRLGVQAVRDLAPSALAGWSPAADVPAEVSQLVAETLAIDPSAVPGLASADTAVAGPAAVLAAARAGWWDTWTDDWRTAPDAAQWSGVPPCPVAVTRPGQPWNPLRLDWEVAWTDVPVRGFELDDLDFVPGPEFRADGPARTLAGLGWLSSAPAVLVAAAARASGVDTGTGLAMADLVSAALEGFNERVRGVPSGVWVDAGGVVDDPPTSTLAAEEYDAVPLAAGVWRVSRLRVVDTFGQALDLLRPATAADPAVGTEPDWPEELDAPGGGLLARPRFTAPAQLAARFLAADVRTDLEAAPGLGPLGGFLLTSPGGTELVGVDGTSHGMLRPDPWTSRTARAPTPTSTGAPDGMLGLLADLVVGADLVRAPDGPDDGALAALLRTVATTRSAVDVTGRAGDSQLGLLLGAPVALLRLGLTLHVEDPQADLAAVQVPVRLGDLGLLTDGVLAWFAQDEPTRLHPVHAAVAEVAADTSGVLGNPLLWLTPGVTRSVVVLAVPATDVTVTSGLLPVKRLEVPREWTDGALRALTPTIAVDALVRDPAALALPTPSGVRGIWTWHTHEAPGAPWRSEEVSATPASAQPGTAVIVQDGYLRVTLVDDQPGTTHTIEVTGIRRGGPTGAIRVLGGVNPDGSPWRLTIERAVEMVESGRFALVARSPAGDVSAPLRVGVSSRGAKYLYTPFDRTTRNNLEELPPCP